MNNNYTPKREITVDTKLWEPNLDVTLPINGVDIPEFKKWVNWKGFSKKHPGFDFAAYINNKNECILGLPSKTPVRATADGVVAQVIDMYGEYPTYITIEHGKREKGVVAGARLLSQYAHVEPLVKDWQPVKKGDVIATLYKDPGNKEGRLVHLHFTLAHAEEIRPRLVDPS
jgi:murein DD-endopeptidase MepM/ murein hydrolase activator NlpD